MQRIPKATLLLGQNVAQVLSGLFILLLTFPEQGTLGPLVVLVIPKRASLSTSTARTTPTTVSLDMLPTTAVSSKHGQSWPPRRDKWCCSVSHALRDSPCMQWSSTLSFPHCEPCRLFLFKRALESSFTATHTSRTSSLVGVSCTCRLPTRQCI